MTQLQQLSAAEFFYRHREMPGFANEKSAAYTTFRELLENGLDATEAFNILPDIRVSIKWKEDSQSYLFMISDNGVGVQHEKIPLAFGSLLVSSKYTIKQNRGCLGMGGKMALMYAQASTQHSFKVASSVSKSQRLHVYELKIDIAKNKPVVLKHNIGTDVGWRGTAVSFYTKADFDAVVDEVQKYLLYTAIANPYANITVELELKKHAKTLGIKRTTTTLPVPPRDSLLHPHGIDAETLRKMFASEDKNFAIVDWMQNRLQRIGIKTATQFLNTVKWQHSKDVRSVKEQELVQLAEAFKSYEGFTKPDTSVLSPLSEVLVDGVKSIFQPEHVFYASRDGSYLGNPYVVELVVGYGGKIKSPTESYDYTFLRFVNKIPLFKDEWGDAVAALVRKDIHYPRYSLLENSPLVIIFHLCSTKIPWRTQGKELIANVPEVIDDARNALQELLRKVSVVISRYQSVLDQKKRVDVFLKYIPRIAEFSAATISKPVPALDWVKGGVSE